MSVTDYNEIAKSGPGKVAKKLKEITKELIISQILIHQVDLERGSKINERERRA